MNKILSIVRYTFIENFRNKIFLVLILFGIVMIFSSVLLGLLSQEQEIRMLLDFGLSSIEIISFLTAVFLMVNLIIEEMGSRTIYLILTRSVHRMEYLLGRYIGTMSSVFSCVILMTLIHAVLLFLKGWKFQDEGFLYVVSVFMSFEKIILISAIALFFSIFSSSAVVSLIFTIFFWILGHFAMELKFLSGEITGQLPRYLFKGIYFLIPHFQYMNARDLWLTVQDQFTGFILKGSLYTLLYSVAFLLLALISFRKKEF